MRHSLQHQQKPFAIPLLLTSYLACEILAPFFASFLVLNAILFLGRIVPFLDFIFDFNLGAADFLRLTAYLLPKLLLFTLPMAGMCAVIIALTRMVNDNEIMALKASGLGLGRLLPPVLLVAIAVSLLTWFAAVNLVPKSTVAMKKLFLHLATEKIDRGIQPGQFSEGLGKMVLYLTEKDVKSGQWRGISLFDLRHGPMPVVVAAKTGSLDFAPESMEFTLNLADGSLHRMTGNLSQIISFDRYRLSLLINTPAKAGGIGFGEVGKNGLSQQQLHQQALRLGMNSAKGLALWIEYHSRLALPVGGLILTLLGLPLALLSRPGQRSLGLPLGLFFFILYYILFTAGKTYAESASLPVALGIWLPNGFFALFTLWLLRQVAGESQYRLLERLIDLLAVGRRYLPALSAKGRRP